MSGMQPNSVRFERSRETLAQAPTQRLSTSLETNVVGAGASSSKREQLRAAAQAFEAVFLRQMIGSMRQAKLGEDILGGSATDTFREMSDAKLADSMAENSSFGIAELLLKQFDGAGARK
jgi:peptidoglycan hydrolase FlgJ